MARKKGWFASGAALLLLTTALVTHWQSRQRPHKETAPVLSRMAAVTRPAAAPAQLLSGTITGKYELCGIGTAPARITADGLNEYVRALTQETSDRWRAALLDSSDLRARAMGLLLRHTEAKFHRPEPGNESSAKPTEDEREELVQLAELEHSAPPPAADALRAPEWARSPEASKP